MSASNVEGMRRHSARAGYYVSVHVMVSPQRWCIKRLCARARDGIIRVDTGMEVASVKQYSCFDILGPIMIGPSSSHTAGAARLGRVARVISGSTPKKVTFYLHGSFAATHRGHGTDKALLAGVLGMLPDDELLPCSFEEAQKLGVTYQLIPRDLGQDVHPNTVLIELESSGGEITRITGSSTGAGKIRIVALDGLPVDFSGDYHTLVTLHEDKPGVVAGVTQELARAGVNIAYMRVFRDQRGKNACMVIESDGSFPDDTRKRIETITGVRRAVVLEPV